MYAKTVPPKVIRNRIICERVRRSEIFLLQITYQRRDTVSLMVRRGLNGCNLARFVPIEMTNDELDRERAVLGFLALNKEGMPYFLFPFPSHALTDFH